jgi:hypothetical protein
MSVKEDFQLPQLAQFVDAHLLLPLLDFAEHRQVTLFSLSISISISISRHDEVATRRPTSREREREREKSDFL